MKKLKSMLVTLAMLLCCISASAHDFEVDGIYYNIKSSEKLIVEVTFQGSNYNSYSNEYTGDVVIPETVTYESKTYSVTSIGDRTFYGCSSLTSITIPNSVTSIGDDAFSGCSSLTSVTIPNSVTSIGGWAFSGTAWYNNQPDGVVYAGKVAYKYKGTIPSNTNIELAEGTLEIAGYAFYGCSNLTSITIPNSVTSIGEKTFCDCSSLTSITIPNSVTSIGEYAFRGCTSLTSIIIPNGVTSIANYAFEVCSSLTSVTIPNSVTSIGNQTFYGCSSLTSVTIPNSVTSIGNQTFYGCSSLTSVTIPDGVTSIGGGAFSGCNGLTSITIPNSVTSIGEKTFGVCSSLTSVVIGNGVTSIGYSAFYGCSSLTSISIPDNITTIEENTFDGCNDLKTVTLPKKLYMIKNQAFQGCSSLKSITIPDSVGYIYQQAFANCKGLESVKVLAETPPFAYDNTFSNYDAKLIVPTASIESYNSTSPWSKFGTIRPIDENIAILTATVGDGGCIKMGESEIRSSTSDLYITKNKETEILITPDEGYAIDKITLDEKDITSQVSEDGTMAIKLTEDAKLMATFKFVATYKTITMTNNVATFCCDKDLDFSNVEGLKAYIASGYNKATNTVLLARIYDVPANTGIVLIGEVGTYPVYYSTSTSWYTNILKGVMEATTISPTIGEYTNYVLTEGSHGIGFYPLSQSGTLAAGKAYLQLPTSVSSAKGISMSFEDETTGICDNYEVEIMNSDAAVYDLHGRKVKNLTKGLYIVNGKKVVIK